MATLVTIEEARRIFEEMHAGRNLKKHHLRGTYTSQNIAALWNQHLKTIAMMEARQQLAEPIPKVKPTVHLYWGGITKMQWHADYEGISIPLGDIPLCNEGSGFKEAYLLAKKLFPNCDFKIVVMQHGKSAFTQCVHCDDLAIRTFLEPHDVTHNFTPTDISVLTDVQKKIYGIICDILGYSPTLNESIYNNPDIDSLDIIETVMAIEEELQVDISDEELATISKDAVIYTFIKFIESKGNTHVNA